MHVQVQISNAELLQGNPKGCPFANAGRDPHGDRPSSPRPALPVTLQAGERKSPPPAVTGGAVLVNRYIQGLGEAARSFIGIQDELDIQLSQRLNFSNRAEEVPPKEGVVQGVICMSLRADEVSAMTISPDRLSL